MGWRGMHTAKSRSCVNFFKKFKIDTTLCQKICVIFFDTEKSDTKNGAYTHFLWMMLSFSVFFNWISTCVKNSRYNYHINIFIKSIYDYIREFMYAQFPEIFIC